MLKHVARQGNEQILQNILTNLAGIRQLAAVPQRLQVIRELRELSGAPISDVKAALDEAEYNTSKSGKECLCIMLALPEKGLDNFSI